MPSNVSIAYRGANYAIGQGPQFYGIWPVAATQSAPIQWWPLTPDGWAAAWTRFTAVEAPGTIVPVAQQPVAPTATWAPAATPAVAPATARRTSVIAAGLLGLGVVLGVIGLFPAYVAGASLASQASNLVPHVIYLAGWSLSAVLIAMGGVRLRAGALFGLGVSAVTLGLFVADVGTPIASGAHLAGAGLVLGILGWVASTVGAGLAMRAGRTGGSLTGGNGAVPQRSLIGQRGRLSSHEIVPLVTLVLAAVGAATAFAPSWDRFALRTASGGSQVITAGNAFANPAPVILGNVATMAAIVAVMIVAALWRPTRLGAALAAGGIVPLVAQAISAVVQIKGPTSPLEFGISPAQASQVGLTISAGLTPMFWVYCAFVATMILLCVWMLLVHEPAMPQLARPLDAGPESRPAPAVQDEADYSDATGLQTGS